MIKILVIGETCQDSFIYCETNRLCPEAPVPVLNPIKTVNNNGMSGNVVDNLMALNSNLNITHCHQFENISKIRYIDEKTNHMFVRIDSGENNISKIKFSGEIKNYDIVIVSDYNKGFMTNEDLMFIGSNSKLSILDSKRKLNNDITKLFTFVKLNENEFKSNKNLIDFNNVIITLGSKGCMFNGDIFKSPKPQETIDVSGAGDTFTSSFILKYFENKEINTSLEFANKMASIVVSKRGVVTP